MKKLSILGLGALAVMCACNSKPTTEYTINGTTDLADGEMIRLTYMANDSMIQDSCIIANGTFTFTGTLDKPTVAYVLYGENTYNNDKARAFVVEPGQIGIALTGDSYAQAEITGSPLTLQMDSLESFKRGIYDQLMPMRQQFMEAQGDSVKMAELEQKYTELTDQLQEAQVNFVKTHPASLYTPMVLRMIKSNLSLDELKELYNGLTPEVQAADDETAKYIAALESIQPGAKAPEITGKDQNGNEVSLSGLKGKVVLVDFWATWCGPCRASLPHVKELFEKYNGKGLEVLAISLDRSEEPWKDYIANSGMGMEKYVNIYDAPVKNADNYAIQYIPSKFVVDAEGNMVGRFDDEAELDAKLAEMLGE